LVDALAPIGRKRRSEALFGVLQGILGDDEGPVGFDARIKLMQGSLRSLTGAMDRVGGLVALQRILGDNEGLVAVDAVGGSMRLYDGSEEAVAWLCRCEDRCVCSFLVVRDAWRLWCSRCRRRIDVFAVVKALGGGDDVIGVASTARRRLSLAKGVAL
jgi:hypothetical protein